jgi:hypothetical protein
MKRNLKKLGKLKMNKKLKNLSFENKIKYFQKKTTFRNIELKYRRKRNFGNNKKKIKQNCVICGVCEKIEIHHIDGDRENGKIDNLISLCNSCHSFVHKTHPLKKEIN